MTPHRVLFHVQHLLGIGHLRRVALIAAACVRNGLDVTVASGGVPISGLDFGGARVLQLPALKSADEGFSRLVDHHGRPVDDAWRTRRRDKLLAILARTRPHVVVIEMFPFGRRGLRFELLPLLDAARAARPAPRVVSSVRDVLTARKPERAVEAAAWASRYFDTVLVHGDPSAIRFEESFPAADEIADRISYSGYVAGPAGRRGGPGSPGWNEVIVSTGGGAVGESLLRTAIEARRYSRSAARLNWRILAGANLSAEAFAGVAEAAGDGLTVERNRDDFPDLLANCAASISQGGYNTVADILQARARAVVVPFARGGQTEQALRAARLEALGLLRGVDEETLTPGRLVAQLDTALAGPRPRPAAVNLEGAERSAVAIAGWAERSER